MTTLVVTRRIEQELHSVVVPVSKATDTEFDAFYIEQLREFLHRHGCNVSHLPDSQLLMQTLHTFQNTDSRRGPITAANPVQSV